MKKGRITAFPLCGLLSYRAGKDFYIRAGYVSIELPNGTYERIEYSANTLEKIEKLTKGLRVEDKEEMERYIKYHMKHSDLTAEELYKRNLSGYASHCSILIDEAAEEAEKQKEAALKEERKHGTGIYVRFGAAPKNGKSHNYRDDTEEDGVSVFRAVLSSDKATVHINLNTQYALGTYLTVYDRQLYRVYGTMIGIGSDGEPLLRVTRSVKLNDKAIETYSEEL